MPITLKFSWENLKQKQLRQEFHLCALSPPCSRTTSPHRDTASPMLDLCKHHRWSVGVPAPRTFPTPQTGQQSLVHISAVPQYLVPGHGELRFASPMHLLFFFKKALHVQYQRLS